MSKVAACSIQKLKFVNVKGAEESLSPKSIEAGEESSRISHRRESGFLFPPHNPTTLLLPSQMIGSNPWTRTPIFTTVSARLNFANGSTRQMVFC